MVRARSAAEMPVVTPSAASIGLAEGGAELRGVARGHEGEAELRRRRSAVEGEADQAAAVLGHEVDDLGGDLLGGDGEVAFVLAVLVVDDDDHAAGAEILNGFGDRRKGHDLNFQDNSGW